MDEIQLETPVQGTVWKVVAKVGQTVETGEIPIESSGSGTLREILVSEGDQVEQDSVVAVIGIS